MVVWGGSKHPLLAPVESRPDVQNGQDHAYRPLGHIEPRLSLAVRIPPPYASGARAVLRALAPHDHLRGLNVGTAVERDLLIAVLLLVLDFACRRQRHRAGQQQAGYTYSPIDAASTPWYITEA